MADGLSGATPKDILAQNGLVPSGGNLDNGGLCLPQSLMGDQRALAIPSFKFPVILRYEAASASLILERNVYTAGTFGISQDPSDLGWASTSATADITTFDKNGILNQKCAWYSDSLLLFPEVGLQQGAEIVQGASAALSRNVGTGNGDSAEVLPTSIVLANFDQFTDQIVQAFFSNTQVYYKGESETCKYIAGVGSLQPSAFGLGSSGIPTNANPIDGTSAKLKHAVVAWPTGVNTKSLLVSFETQNAFAVQFDATAAANAGIADNSFVFVTMRAVLQGPGYDLSSGRRTVSGGDPDADIMSLRAQLAAIQSQLGMR